MKRKIQFMAMLLIGILLSVNQAWGATESASSSSLTASTSYQDLQSGKLIEYKNSAANSYSAPLRIYQNNTFTFHCKTGATKITKIVVTANSTSYATATKNATWAASGEGTCSVSKSASGTSATINVTGTATTVTCKPSEQIRWDGVEVTYESTTGANYTVNYSLTNVTKQTGVTSITSGSKFNATFTANSGYSMPATIGVKVGSTEINKGNSSTGYEWYSSDGTTWQLWLDSKFVTGNITVTINGIASSLTDITIDASNQTVTTGDMPDVRSWFNITPAGYDGKITFSSDNTDVFAVDEKVGTDGSAWGLADQIGTAHVTLTANSTSKYNGSSKTITVNVVAAATPHNITYVVPSGVTPVSGENQVTSVASLKTANSPCDDYDFVGWSTNSACSTTPEYAKGAGIASVTTDMTLYAVYGKKTAGTGTGTYVRMTDAAELTSGQDLVVVYKVSSTSVQMMSKGTGTAITSTQVTDATEYPSEISVSNSNLLWRYEGTSTNATLKNNTSYLTLGDAIVNGSSVTTGYKAATSTTSKSWKIQNSTTHANLFWVTTPADSKTGYLELYSSTWQAYLLAGTPSSSQGANVSIALYKKQGSAYSAYSTDPSCVKTYTVSFNVQGHGTAPSAQLIYGGEKATEPTEPTATGYNFGGWFKESSCTNQWNFSTMTVTGDITLYAKWTAKEYKVTLSKNNKATTNGSVTLTYNSNSVKAFTAVSGVPAGYTLRGYYHSSVNGEGTLILSKEGELQNVTVDNWMNAGKWVRDLNDVYLYAQYDLENYSITYNDLNGATNSNPTSYTVESETIVLAAPGERSGYRFGGWFTGADGAGTQVTQIASGSTGNKVVYAKWTAVTYTDYITSCTSETEVTFDPNDGSLGSCPSATTIEQGSTDPVCYGLSRTGYTFAGFYTEAEGGEQIFAADGTMQTVAGYTESGWSYAGTELTLYAHWTPIQYTITYHDELNASNSNPKKYTIETADITLTNLTKSNYSFEGWYSDEAKTQKVTGVAITHGSTGDKEFWANWTANSYTVTLDKNGGSADGTATVSYHATTLTSITHATRTGYTLNGYFDATSAGNKIIQNDGTLLVGKTGYTNSSREWIKAENCTLYAQWTAKAYTVNFDKQGGSSGVNGVTATYDAAMPAATMPTKAGYTFGGYYSGTNGTGTQYYDNTGASAHVWDIDANPTTLYAYWTVNTHSLTLVKGTGDCEKVTEGIAYGTVVNIEANSECIPRGYHFGSWTVNEGGVTLNSNTANPTSFTMGNADVRITANYVANQYSLTLKANDGAATADQTATVTYDATGTSATSWNKHSRTGYVLTGYFTEAEGGVMVINDSKALVIGVADYTDGDGKWVRDEAVTLWAHWTVKTTTITLRQTDATVSATQTSVVATYGQPMPTLESVPERTGYLFSGYFDAAGGSGTQYYDGMGTSVTNWNKDGATATLYPYWVASSYSASVTLGGDIKLTSAVDAIAGSATGAFTIHSDRIDDATAIRITYKDVTNDVLYPRSGTPYYVNSEFRLANNSNYNFADETNIDVSALNGAYDATFAVRYQPTAAGQMDHYQIIVEVLRSTTLLDKQTLDVYGRTLSNQFVVATNYNGMWYALPNNMPSEGTHAALPIGVDIETMTAIAPNTAVYSLGTYKQDSYKPLRFIGTGGGLWGSNAVDGNGIRNWSTTENTNMYGWELSIVDWENGLYTMSPLSSSRNLNLYNQKWGLNGNVHSEDVYFLPISEIVDPALIYAREWKADGVVFAYNDGRTTESATYQIGSGAAADAQLKNHATKGVSLYEITTTNLEASAGKLLRINLGSKVAFVTIPIIVASDKSTSSSAPFTTIGTASGNYDVVVLGGNTLTTDAATTGAHKFNNMYIYPGATLVNATNANLSLNYLELRGGIKGIDAKNSKEQAVPYVYLGKQISQCKQGANLVMAVDVAHDYAVSVPFAVDLDNVNYTGAWSTSTGNPMVGTIGSQFRIARYDTEQRANTGTGWKDITSGTMTPGVGYTMQAKMPSGQPYAYISFPLATNTAGVKAWTDKENGEIEKAAVTLSNAGCDNDKVSDNNKGWNMLSDPFLAKVSYTGADPDAIVGSLVKSTLEKHLDEHGNWTGTYDWKTDSETRTWLSVPNDRFTEYSQVRASAHTYEPCKVFFVQATSPGEVSFARTDRKQNAPARALMVAEETMEPVIADFMLSHGGKTVYSGMTIDEEATVGYKLGEDQLMMEGRDAITYLKTFMVVDEHDVVGNTLTPAEAEQMIPVEVYAPDMTGEYTFAIDESSDLEKIQSMTLLDRNTGDLTNLLNGTYTFTVDKTGFTGERFAINVVLVKEDDTTTDLENSFGGKNIRKIIYNDKLFIVVDGKVYDGTGKLVSK